MKIALILITTLLSMPISLYITYSILSLLPVDRLVWFLFWINIPLILLVQTLSRLTEKK